MHHGQWQLRSRRNSEVRQGLLNLNGSHDQESGEVGGEIEDWNWNVKVVKEKVNVNVNVKRVRRDVVGDGYYDVVVEK